MRCRADGSQENKDPVCSPPTNELGSVPQLACQLQPVAGSHCLQRQFAALKSLRSANSRVEDNESSEMCRRDPASVVLGSARLVFDFGTPIAGSCLRWRFTTV